MSNENKTNAVNKLQKSRTSQMLDRIEDRQQQQKTINKLDELLEINLKHQVQKAEKAENKEQTEKLQQALKDLHKAQQNSDIKNKYASSVRFGNPQDSIYTKALEETQKMVQLAQEAQDSKPNDSKQSSDLVQLNKKEPVESTNTKSFIDNQAAISQQIAEDNKFQFKAVRIAEEVAIKGNMPDNQEREAKSDFKKENINKNQSPNNSLEVSVSLNNTGDHNQESKGKAYIIEEIKEKIQEANTKTPKRKKEKKQENKPKDIITFSEEAEKIRKKPTNKLKAKFNKHKH